MATILLAAGLAAAAGGIVGALLGASYARGWGRLRPPGERFSPRHVHYVSVPGRGTFAVESPEPPGVRRQDRGCPVRLLCAPATPVQGSFPAEEERGDWLATQVELPAWWYGRWLGGEALARLPQQYALDFGRQIAELGAMVRHGQPCYVHPGARCHRVTTAGLSGGMAPGRKGSGEGAPPEEVREEDAEESDACGRGHRASGHTVGRKARG